MLDNGDRLSGTVQRLADGKLVFHTEYAGNVEIDVKRVATLRADSEMTVVLEDNTRLYGRLSGDAHKLEIAEAGQTVDLAQVTHAGAGADKRQGVAILGTRCAGRLGQQR